MKVLKDSLFFRREAITAKDILSACRSRSKAQASALLTRPLGLAAILAPLVKENKITKKEMETLFRTKLKQYPAAQAMVSLLLAETAAEAPYQVCHSTMMPVYKTLPLYLLSFNARAAEKLLASLEENIRSLVGGHAAGNTLDWISSELLRQLFYLGSRNERVHVRLSALFEHFVAQDIDRIPHIQRMMNLLLCVVDRDSSYWRIVAAFLDRQKEIPSKLKKNVCLFIMRLIVTCRDDCIQWTKEYIKKYYYASEDHRSKIAREIVKEIRGNRRFLHRNWITMLIELEQEGVGK